VRARVPARAARSLARPARLRGNGDGGGSAGAADGAGSGAGGGAATCRAASAATSRCERKLSAIPRCSQLSPTAETTASRLPFPRHCPAATTLDMRRSPSRRPEGQTESTGTPGTAVPNVRNRSGHRGNSRRLRGLQGSHDLAGREDFLSGVAPCTPPFGDDRQRYDDAGSTDPTQPQEPGRAFLATLRRNQRARVEDVLDNRTRCAFCGAFSRPEPRDRFPPGPKRG
jgi:hypothetical protein